MKYFNSAFMKFTVKDYTLSGRHSRSAWWWAVWFPHFFSFWPRNSYYEAQRIRRKEWWRMNIWIFLLSGLLWMTSPFSSRPKSLPMANDKSSMTFSHGREWRLNQRNVEAYRWKICQGNPFQNWGWYDPYSQGEVGKESRASLFNPTDWSTSGYKGSENSLEGS